MRAAYLSAVPVAAIADRLGLPDREAGNLVEALRRLGVESLGHLAALSAAQVADRFGPPGLRALRLARGEDELLACHRRGAREEVAVEIDLPEGTAGERLERALELLVDRLLAAPRRKERTVLAPRLAELPAPAVSLSLRSLGLGPRAADQLELAVRGDESRRRRLGAALREVRATQGANSLLKVLPVDTASRVPERRAILTPYPVPAR